MNRQVTKKRMIRKDAKLVNYWDTNVSFAIENNEQAMMIRLETNNEITRAIK